MGRSLNPLHGHPEPAAILERVEAALRESVRSEDPFLTEVASHLIVAGGKRLRPAYVGAAGTVLDSAPDVDADLVSGGVSVELVHLGSLYHDDVMDEAATRRGVETVNHRWGNLRAILAGDYLLAKASEIASSLGTEVAGLLAATIARLCEGQVIELQLIYDRSRSEAQYNAAIEGKTASLYASACRIGSLVREHDRELTDRLTEFGRLYGMAFQVVDDILDLVATDEELGKPSGNDLVEGVYTLPVIRAVADTPDGELASLLGEVLEPAQRDRARQLVRESGQIESCVSTVQSYCDDALALLADLDDTPSAVGMRAASTNLLSSLPTWV